MLIKTPAPENTQTVADADMGASLWLNSISSVLEERPWHFGDTKSDIGEGGEVGPGGACPSVTHNIDFK